MDSTAKEPKSSKDEDKKLADVAALTNGKERSKVKFEGMLPREEAISYFEAIVAGMKKGTIQLRQGEESVTLKLPEQVSLEVKAATKGDKEKIRFELAWHAPAGSDLKISSN